MKFNKYIKRILFLLMFVLPNILLATSVIVSNTNNTGPGSLRQAIIDANTSPVDSIVFRIPLTDPNYNALRGVFRINITGLELNPITRANLVIDGTTQTAFTGNTNSVMLGLGGTVGVDSIAFPKFDGPEIEIVDLNNDTTGIKIMASYVKVRGLCVYGFGRGFKPSHGNIVVYGSVKHVIIENNVLGVPADQLIKPDLSLYSLGCNIMIYYADSGIVRNNLSGWGGAAGLYFNQSQGWLIEFNEFTSNGFFTPNLDGSDLGYTTKGCIERYNHSYSNAANGMDSYLSIGDHVFENNTIENNGIRCWETTGLRIYGVNNYIYKNIIRGNIGSGILVNSDADRIVISENSIFDNGSHSGPYNSTPFHTIGIDLSGYYDDSNIGTAPYYNLNDNGDCDFGANNLTNYPVVTNANIIGSNFVVEGFAQPGAKLEFFIGDTSSLKDFPQGKTFLFSKVEGSADDLNGTTGSYGPLPINGINQGQDSTNKFKFIVPVPAKLHLGDVITATSTLSNRTSEFSPAAKCQLGVNPLSPVVPMFDCVYKNHDGTYNAVFAYSNSNPNTINIPVGVSNQFIPAPQAQGQPTAFLTGVHNLAFSVPFSGSSLTWRLDSTFIVVTPTSNQCQVDLGVTKLLSSPAPNSNDTIFKGDTVTFSITLKNHSPYFPSSDISLLDTLPSAFTFVSASANNGTYNHLTGLWTIATLNSLDSAVLTVKATVDTSSQNDVYIIAQSQPDPNTLNNHSFASATMTSSSSGNDGGLESNGSLASKIAIRNFIRHKDDRSIYKTASNLQPFFENMDISDVPTSKNKSTQSTELVSFIPQNGPGTSTAFITTPTDLLTVSNALEVFAVDYFANNTDRKAAILGIATPAATVYGHTKFVCDRLNGASLENINHVTIKNHSFILAKLVQDNGDVDYAISFIAYKNGTVYSIDNRWDLESYKPNGTQAVLNFQVWSTSERNTMNLVAAILDKIDVNYSLNYINNFPALIPTVYVKSGYYDNGNLILNIVNNANAKNIMIDGSTAITESGSRTDYHNLISIPSSQTTSRVVIPVTNIFDIGFAMRNDNNSGTDVLYYADGPWGTDIDPDGATLSNLAIDGNNFINYSNSYNVARNASASGTVLTYASMFRVLKAGNKATDVSNYKYIEFNATGSGLYTLTLSKKSITTWSNQYKTTVNLTASSTHYKILLSSLYNASGMQNMNANDILAVVFTKMGNNTSYQNFNITVSNLHFSTIIQDVEESKPIETTATLNVYPNPFTQSTTISFDLNKTSKVKVSVYNLEGKLISILSDQAFSEGTHNLQFDAANLNEGVYIVRLESDSFIHYKKIILMR